MGTTTVSMTCKCTLCNFHGTVPNVTQWDKHEQVRWTCPKCGFLWKPVHAPRKSSADRAGAALLDQDREIRLLRSAIQDIADGETGGLDAATYAYAVLNPE